MGISPPPHNLVSGVKISSRGIQSGAKTRSGKIGRGRACVSDDDLVDDPQLEDPSQSRAPPRQLVWRHETKSIDTQ